MSEAVFISLHQLLAAAWRRRYFIAVPTLLMPLFGLLIGTMSPRQWETHTTVLIQESATLNPFLEDLSIATNLKGRMAALETLVHSRHVLLNVAQDLGRVDADTSNIERDRIINQLSAGLSVGLVGSDLVKLSYRSSSTEGIAETLSVVKTHFLTNLLAPEISSINASETFLDEQLDERRIVLRQAEQNVANFKRRHATDLPDLHGANVIRLRQLKSDLAERKTTLAGALAALNSIRDRLVHVDPVIGRLEEEIVNVSGELALLRARYTDNHSKVRANLRSLNRLEAERISQLGKSAALADTSLERLWSLADGMDGAQADSNSGTLLISQLQALQSADALVKRVQEEVTSLAQQVSHLGQRVIGFGEIERSMGELERDLDVQRNLYNDLLQRFEKARVTGALGRFEQPERVKIIDAPFIPSAPVNLPLVVFVLAGVLGGLSMGAGMALVAELTDTTIRCREQVVQLLGVPVLSRLPRLQSVDIKLPMLREENANENR